MDTRTSDVGFTVHVEGVDGVLRDYELMGNAIEKTAAKVSTMGATTELSYRRMALSTASLMMNTMQLVDVFDRMAKGQLDLGRGTMILALNFLQLATNIMTLMDTQNLAIAKNIAHALSSVGVAVAENARAVAHAIANAVASSGTMVPAMIAGAAAAAIGVTAIISSSQGTRHQGGAIEVSGSYGLLAREHVLTEGQKDIVSLALDALRAPRFGDVNITVVGSSSPEATGDAVIQALRRFGSI